jgi:mycofactocin precursor
MTENSTLARPVVDEEPAETLLDRPAPQPEQMSAESLVEADQLVEDVSIDGMCGVY